MDLWALLTMQKIYLEDRYMIYSGRTSSILSKLLDIRDVEKREKTKNYNWDEQEFNDLPTNNFIHMK